MTNKRLLNIRELMEYAGLGRNKAIEWGKEIKAEVRIGRRVLYDKAIIDKVLDRMGTVANDNENPTKE